MGRAEWRGCTARQGDNTVIWPAPADTEIAIVNLGEVDWYWRGFSGPGCARADQAELPVLGRVSMDLTVSSVDAVPNLAGGDWATFDYALVAASAPPWCCLNVT